MKNLIIRFLFWIVIIICACFTVYTIGCVRKNVKPIEILKPIEIVKPKTTYTYASKINPVQFFKYTVIKAVQTANNGFVLSLKSTTLKPIYAINVVIIVDKTIYILAYAYFDNNNLEFFAFDRETKNFAKTIPNSHLQILLEKKLNKLHGIQST